MEKTTEIRLKAHYLEMTVKEYLDRYVKLIGQVRFLTGGKEC